ncbi:MAG TPA: class I SAM-dependent methyltransferase [Candidatus Paceibacterota bacterium]
MLKQFFHNTMDGKVSEAWMKRSAVKLFDQPRVVVCIPIGSKLSQNVTTKDGEIIGGPTVRIPGTVPVQWLKAQMQLAHPLNNALVYLTQHGMYSGQARQVLTVNALRMVQEDGYVLYWDDDTLPPEHGLYTMLNYMEQHPEVGVLSAVYCTRSVPCEPVLFKQPTTGTNWDFAMGPDAVPEEIYSAGAGFMLVRAAAIRKAIAMNPDEPVWADMKVSRTDPKEQPGEWGLGLTWGHDIRFCRLIANAGYKIMVDGRVECGHLDLETQQIHYLPDTCLPKRRGRNYHGEQYWNKVYSREGVENMRINGALFENVLSKIEQFSTVVELGCGPGVFGQLITAQGACHWSGFDQSETAVEMCCARFLNAYKKMVHEITAEDLSSASVVVAMEVIEHLEPEDYNRLFGLVTSLKKRFIFTVPNNCMGPEEIPEHNDLFNEEKVREITRPFCEAGDYALSVEKGDDHRLLCIMQPK